MIERKDDKTTIEAIEAIRRRKLQLRGIDTDDGSHRKLETVEEHNERTRAAREARDLALRSTGVACPKCGAELLHDACGTTTLSFPPRRFVRCPKCNTTDYLEV